MAGITALHFCIFRGKNDQAIAIIESGEADLNAGDQGGQTPIHMACYKDSVDLVKRLIEAGADGTKVDGSGNTPLHAAAGAGAAGVIEYLAEKGFGLGARNVEGLTALEVAQQHCPPRQRAGIVKSLQALIPADEPSVNSSNENNGNSAPRAAGGTPPSPPRTDAAVPGVPQFPRAVPRLVGEVAPAATSAGGAAGGVRRGIGKQQGASADSAESFWRMMERQQDTIQALTQTVQTQAHTVESLVCSVDRLEKSIGKLATKTPNEAVSEPL